jgi:ribosomal protein L11 methyltransferase
MRCQRYGAEAMIRVTVSLAESPAADGRVHLDADVDPLTFGHLEAEISASPCPDGWWEGWREFAKPVRVGRLLVRPPWVEAQAEPGAVELLLDAGRAFGTGAHPSTTLALALLDTALAARPESAVLDVGCGSGALCIAAALLDADRVVAIDVDDEAVRATSSNAEANGVATRIAVSKTPVTEVAGAFDIVVANLGSPLVVVLAPAIAARSGHVVILSGLLADRWIHVPAAYPDFDLLDTPSDGDWRALLLARR